MNVHFQSNSLVLELTAVANLLGIQFVFKNQPIAHEVVFDNNGLLPAIVKKADHLCTFCFGYGLGLSFERSDTALLGVSLQLDEVIPKSLRLLCIVDVLVELIQQSPDPSRVSLDQLASD